LSGRLARVPVYPLLLAAYPILALFARNAHQVRTSELTLPIAVVVAIAGATWLAFGLLLRGAAKGAVATAAATLIFYSAEPAAEWASNAIAYATGFWVTLRVKVGPAWVLVPEAALLVAAIVWAARGARGLVPLTIWLNTMAVIVTALAVVPIVQAKAPVGHDHGETPADATIVGASRPTWRPSPLAPLSTPPGSRPPDIYYIILDGYARHDVMRSHFDYDNSAFLEHLEGRGFYVARNSTSNYCQTLLSLSSSLNGVYLDEMVKGLQYDRTTLREYIGRSSVLASLEPLGYGLVTFATGFDATEHPEAYRFLSPLPHTTEFLRMAMDMTPMRRLDPREWDAFQQARLRINYLFDHLPDVAKDPRPTFTLAHVLCPHPPMIFGPDGEDVGKANEESLVYAHEANGRLSYPDRFRRAYRDQATYVTKRIQQTIDRILAESPEPPIIIVQSDHGSELYHDQRSAENTDHHERMSIFNAYYFPGARYEGLNDSISPVNSFRVVFNTFFGASLPSLPERSYYSSGLNPYRFINVTAVVRPESHDPGGRGKSLSIDRSIGPTPPEGTPAR
jgi:hypothetical protein